MINGNKRKKLSKIELEKDYIDFIILGENNQKYNDSYDIIHLPSCSINRGIATTLWSVENLIKTKLAGKDEIEGYVWKTERKEKIKNNILYELSRRERSTTHLYDRLKSIGI